MHPVEFKKLQALGLNPGVSDPAWLRAASDSVEYLKENASADHILVFASLRHAWVVSLFVKRALVSPPDHAELSAAQISSDDRWHIERSESGGERKIVLAPPVGSWRSRSLVDAEPIVFRRSFDGMRDFEVTTELNQKLVHALNLHFLEERQAYCRLNRHGDIEEVIRIIRIKSTDGWNDQHAVFVSAKDLAEYMAVGELSLLRRFDFTRFQANFGGWGQGHHRNNSTAPDLYYNGGVDAEGSYVNGHQLIHPKISVEDLIDAWIQETDPARKKYETFKIVDWKNSELVEVSCGPEGIVNYFTESEKPWEVSPAFFRPEVLHKYKADPEKYELRDRTITCRNSWHLKTYDINEQGQVHTYIRYLADLPYEEQQYWKLFNEWPKGPISKRAFENDIKGEFASDPDPLSDLRMVVARLDACDRPWWKVRGRAMADAIQYPATTSSKEWSDEILALDHLVVEGFVASALRTLAAKANATVESKWGSLKIIQAVLELTMPPSECAEVMEPFSKLHHLRNKVKGHATEEKKSLEKRAIAEHGSLKAHFRALVEKCARSLEIVADALIDRNS